MPVVDVLSNRTLNRTLLDRQMLLDRAEASVAEVMERLVGMQAQEPRDPYVALWSRVVDFAPDALAELLRKRRAVRASMMRATIHLVTATDYLLLRPVMSPVLERAFNGTAWSRQLAGVDRAELLEAGRALLTEQPLGRADLRKRLAERWPDHDAESLAMAVSYLLPLVQVTPRGLWTETARPAWTTSEAWLGNRPGGGPMIDAVVLRYLAAFGPATVADMSNWSRLTGLRAVFERMRPRLRTFRNEDGRELFDVRDAPIRDPDTAAPPRFLPVYDNVFLGHADRRRITPQAFPPSGFDWSAALLVDGMIAGTWKVERNKRAATLVITSFVKPSKKSRAELVEEAERFLAFIAWDAETADLRLTVG